MTTNIGLYSSSFSRWKIVIVAAIALFIFVFDMVVTTMSLPSIASDLSITLRSVAWVVIISSLTMCAFMLPLGRVADVYGRKKLHIIGLVIFIIGSIIIIISPGLSSILFGRFLMSIGNAICSAVAFAIIISSFPDQQKGKALGIITTTVGLGSSIGPLLSGVLIPVFEWRGMFVIMGILSFGCLILSYIVLDKRNIDSTKSYSISDYDWIGAILSAVFFTLLIVTISNPFKIPWISFILFSLFLFSIIFLYLFIRWELKYKNPMIDLRIFSNSTFSLSSLVRLCGFIGNSAVFFLIPIFVQSFLGLSPINAGLILFSTAAGVVVSSLFSGRYSDKYGTKRFILFGLSLIFITGIFLAFITAQTKTNILMLVLFVNGLGMGLFMAPNMRATLSDVSRDNYATFSAFLNQVRNVATAIGQAVSTAIITGIMLMNGNEVGLSEISANSGNDSLVDSFLFGWKIAFIILGLVILIGFITAYKVRSKL
ncbi:MAG: hypothetical protein CL778_03315 [Chloroflexi bacterium]|nr:hypothetical protein [Chloroflexota bacterium]